LNLSNVIAQLRAYCPPLGGRVGGAADYAVGTDTVIAFTDASGMLAYPAAVVIPLEDEAEDPDSLQGPQLNQNITERIGVIVEFDASADRRGQAGVDQVQAMKYALHAAILNWNPDPARSSNGLRYAGGRLLDLDRARLFWQFDYALSVFLSDADGWPLRGDPLTDVQTHVTGLDPEIVFDSPVSQG
jgi:hypothetical protein